MNVGYGSDKVVSTERGATTALTELGVHVPVFTLIRDPEQITG